jgi:hypothetical protein
MLDNNPMVLVIKGVHQLAATASGVDKAHHPVQADVIAYVMDAEDLDVAIAVVETQVLNEPVIPDGTGGFTKPTNVKVTSVVRTTVLQVAPLVYRHTGPGADEKFPVNSIYEIQVVASMSFGHVSTTISVYPLNGALRASIAVAQNDVIKLPILPDPENPGQMDTPDNVIAISANPVSNAPLSAYILLASAVIPNWPDQVVVARGGFGLPSADELGLKVNLVTVPNDGTHGPGDVKSLSPTAGTEVPVGTLVTVTIWGQSGD